MTVWQLDFQLPVQSVPITTMSVVFPGTPVSSANKIDRYNSNIVVSGAKHHKPTNKIKSSKKTQIAFSLVGLDIYTNHIGGSKCEEKFDLSLGQSYGVSSHFQQYFSYIGAVSFIGGETGVPGENHLLVASHWQILSHYVVSSTTRLSRF